MDKKKSFRIYQNYSMIEKLSIQDIRKIFDRFVLECSDLKPLLAGLLLDNEIGNISHIHQLAKSLTDFLDRELDGYIDDMEDTDNLRDYECDEAIEWSKPGGTNNE